MKVAKTDYTKIGFNMSNELLARVDEYASGLHINRSSAISVLVSQALEYKDAISMVGTLPDLVNRAEALKAESKKNE